MLISLAAQKKWSIRHMDVKSSFLNGYLEEEVYVEQPQGFEVEGKENNVYKLKKALYGLKQAPGAWHARIDGYFQENGFQRNWGGSLDDRKSTSGNCFSFGSGLITWSSKKQSIVALSSTEAKYVAITSASTQALWLRKFLEEIGEKQIQPTVIYCDNVSAIKLAKNPIHHSRTKHFDLKYHFIRDLVQKKDIELKHINT
eukprot:PITA_34244